MLVLSVKLSQPGEEDDSIMIGDEIEVSIQRIDGTSVRLGIKAPRQIPVHRKKVYEDIRRSNREAATSSRMIPKQGLEKLRGKKQS